jgi:hypothetical protein
MRHQATASSGIWESSCLGPGGYFGDWEPLGPDHSLHSSEVTLGEQDGEANSRRTIAVASWANISFIDPPLITVAENRPGAEVASGVSTKKRRQLFDDPPTCHSVGVQTSWDDSSKQILSNKTGTSTFCTCSVPYTSGDFCDLTPHGSDLFDDALCSYVPVCCVASCKSSKRANGKFGDCGAGCNVNLGNEHLQNGHCSGVDICGGISIRSSTGILHDFNMFHREHQCKGVPVPSYDKSRLELTAAGHSKNARKLKSDPPGIDSGSGLDGLATGTVGDIISCSAKQEQKYPQNKKVKVAAIFFQAVGFFNYLYRVLIRDSLKKTLK